jgi:hypothetical protein
MIETVIPAEVRRTASALREQAEHTALDVLDDLRASADQHVERVAARWDEVGTDRPSERGGLARWRPGAVIAVALLAVAAVFAAGRVRRALADRGAVRDDLGATDGRSDEEQDAAEPDHARHLAAGAVAPQGQMAAGGA